jgi:hypothetical protein
VSLLAENPDEIYTDLLDRAKLVLGDDWTPHGVSEVLLRVFAGAAAEINTNWNERIEQETVETQGDLLRIPILEGLPASASITIEAIDTAGYTLPAETTVWIGGSAGNAIECATTADATITPGNTDVSVGIETVDNTSEHNGADGDVQLDALDWINGAILDAPLEDGVDPETAEEYRPRLADETQILATAISRPADAVTWCLRHQEVGWAYAVDHYDATTNTADLPLTFTVVVADDDAGPVDADVLTELREGMEELRDSNYVIRVVNAEYVDIDVTAQVQPQSGWSSADAVANSDAALEVATSPAAHIAAPAGADPDYVPPSRIYSTDLIRAAYADGVMHVIPSTFEIGDGSADYIDLPSPIHLPQTGTINVTAA